MFEISIIVFTLLIMFGSFKDWKFNSKVNSCHRSIEESKICQRKLSSLNFKEILHEQSYRNRRSSKGIERS